MKYKIIGDPLPYKEVGVIYENSKRICDADEGWASIIKCDDEYYRLDEVDGLHIHPVMITDSSAGPAVNEDEPEHIRRLRQHGYWDTSEDN